MIAEPDRVSVHILEREIDRFLGSERKCGDQESNKQKKPKAGDDLIPHHLVLHEKPDCQGIYTNPPAADKHSRCKVNNSDTSWGKS
jgi:hypothetical protein